MNWANIALWGSVASIVQMTIEAGGRALGITRMGLPLMLGTMITANRDRAMLYGVAAHFIDGLLLSLVYALIFESWRSAWWTGAIVGAGHGMFVLLVVLPMMPLFHRRMAGEDQGPEPTPLLEPPGFMAANYGRMTTIVTLIAHILYGTILGQFYQPVGG